MASTADLTVLFSFLVFAEVGLDDETEEQELKKRINTNRKV